MLLRVDVQVWDTIDLTCSGKLTNKQAYHHLKHISQYFKNKPLSPGFNAIKILN